MLDMFSFDYVAGLDDDPVTSDPDFSWTSDDGSDQSVAAYFDVTGEGVSFTLQTLTCGYGVTAATQPMPAAAVFALSRLLSDAATKADLMNPQRIGARR